MSGGGVDAPDSAPPVVSGVSPREGLPGTKIVIRGENLGTQKDDISSVIICGVNCLGSLEYSNSKKLTCVSPKVVGPGDIIVNTYSGGKGRCTVTFTGLQPDPVSMLDTLQESDVWMEEDYDSVARVFSDTAESPVYTRDLSDPLGQNIASTRKTRAGSENLGDLFQNESSSLTDENFNPVLHLLEKHRYTSFSDLKSGLRQLKKEVKRNDQAPVQFMRDNLDAFLQCYDTLSDVNELLIRNESKSEGGSLTDRAEELLRESTTRAKNVFEDILVCKVRADTTRNALTVLQRYRFLFSLPKSIEKNIKNHEYDLVATDYEKAKSLFSSTQVNIFKRVLEEVEKQIANFRDDLKEQLLILPSTLNQQKRIIKYLLELDCDGDPAWDCISNMNLWILRLLYTSKEDNQSLPNNRGPGELASLPEDLSSNDPLPPVLPPRGKSSWKEGHSRSISEVSYASTSSYGSQSAAISSPSPLRTSSNIIKISGAGGMPLLKGRGGGGGGGRRADISGPPNRIVFVEDVTEIFCMTLPDLWKLGQAYLKRSLFQGVALLTENQRKLAKKCDSNKTKFEFRVVEIIEIYTTMVNCALFPDAYEDLKEATVDKLGEWSPFDDDILETSGVWLPQIVRRVRECVSMLEGVGLPEKGITMLHHLAMNVRSLCTDTLFQRAAKDIKVLHEREDWKGNYEEGCIVTSLPVLFENRVIDVLLTLKEIVNETQEETLPEVNNELRETAKKHFDVLFDHFLACIDDLAFHSEEELSLDVVGQNVPPSTTTSRDRQLLILMSNMNYLIVEVIPSLFTCFINHGYPSCMELQNQIVKEAVSLDDKIFENYITLKSDSLQGIIEQGMQIGYFDWEQASEPTEVRSYVREILMNLVLIHSEVYAVSALIVPRVLHRLVKIISEEFYQCISEVESFNDNGVIHAFIEVTALEDLLEPYRDEDSRRNFELSKKHLGDRDTQSINRVTDIVGTFKKNSRLQLKCFQSTTTTPTPSEAGREGNGTETERT